MTAQVAENLTNQCPDIAMLGFFYTASLLGID